MPALESLQRKVGPYRLVEKIGEGGMGVVYLARDAENRPVAVKLLGPGVSGDPSARLRLFREVETMRRVRSRYVAQILDADVSGPAPYIVTQYVPGRTLDDIVRKDGPLRGAQLARLATGLAEALAAIHAAGVVHRDLKPANVMLVDGHPVVIDFGIAHIPDAARLTQTGLVMGTPGYLAPEVIEGQPSSGAADVHSWGATVVFAATGRHPYGTGTYQAIFYRVLRGTAELDGVPAPLLPLVAAALAVDPRARPAPEWLARQCAQLWLDRPAYPGPAQARADVADLLPPVDYSRGYVPAPGPATPPGGQVAGHGLLVLAAVTAAVALSVLLPVAGTVLSLAVITLLRAADRAQAGLAARRSVRGARPSDIVIVVVTAPWTVARALLTTVALAPLALLAAGGAAAVSVALAHTQTLPAAGSWAAGAAVAMYSAGPGSRPPRRQLRRISAALIRGRMPMAGAVIAAWALAAAVVTSALSQPPLIWPAASWMLPHILPSVGGTLHAIQQWLLRNTVGMLHLP